MKNESMKKLTISVALSVLVTSGAAQATLVDRGGGLIFDTDLNVTWQDANTGNTFGVSGIYYTNTMTWTTAKEWIGAMNASNGGAGYLGYNNWRLPTSDGCLGYNCTGSELGHLFYNELGGGVGASISARHNANYALFPSIQDQQYWSGTEYAPDASHAYFFNFVFGASSEVQKSAGGVHAWAVRNGDVASVPVPATVWLLGSGLMGLIGVARKRKADK